jgi:hypothetical protein
MKIGKVLATIWISMDIAQGAFAMAQTHGLIQYQIDDQVFFLGFIFGVIVLIFLWAEPKTQP